MQEKNAQKILSIYEVGLCIGTFILRYKLPRLALLIFQSK